MPFRLLFPVFLCLASYLPVMAGGIDLYVTASADSSRVSVDGTEKGFTPIKITGLAEGTVTILVEKQGYCPVTRRLTLTAGAPNSFNAELVRATGRLVISSDPAGARISLKGKPAGQTPMTIDNMATGPCPVRLSMDGLADCDTVVRVTESATVTFHHLFRKKGSLFIASEPLGAAITIDGEPRGTTPCTIPDIQPGIRTVRLAKEGFQPLQQAVTAVPESTVSVTLALSAIKPAGRTGVTLFSRPEGADIEHHGTVLGTTPLSAPLQLPAGTQVLTIRKKGYEPLQVTVNRDDTAHIRVELIPKTSGKALLRSFLPGWGQAYAGTTEKAFLFASLEGACLAGSAFLFYRFMDQSDTYTGYDDAYRSAATQTDMDRYDGLRTTAYQDLETTTLLLNICSATAAAVWLANLADAYFLFPEKDKTSDIKFNLSCGNGGLQLGMNF